MKKYRAIVKSSIEPQDHEVIWEFKNKLYHWLNGDWKPFIISDPNDIFLYGDTSNRPSKPTIGQSYFDTDLGMTIWWNGTKWITYDGERKGDIILKAEDNSTVMFSDAPERIWINTFIDANDMKVYVPRGTKVVFGPNGKLGKGVTLALESTVIEANPRQQIFSDTNITGRMNVPFVYPEWWGAKGDGVTDDSTAINNCFKVASKSTVLMTAERYKVNSTIIIDEEISDRTYTDEETYQNDGHYGMQVLLKGSIWGTANASPVLHINMSQLTFRCDGAIVCHPNAEIAVECNSERHSDIYINRIMRGRDYTNTVSSEEEGKKYNWFTGIGFFHIGGNGGRIQINTMFGFKYGYRASTEICNQYYISWMSNKINLGTIIAPYPIYIWLASDQEGTVNNSRHNSFYHNNDITIQSNSVGWNLKAISTLMNQETDSTLITLKSESGYKRIAVNVYVQTSDCANYKILNAYNAGKCNITVSGSFNDIAPTGTNGEAAKNCINNTAPYTATNKFINIVDCYEFNIKTDQDLCYDWLYVNNNGYVTFNTIQNKWDINSYYMTNYSKLRYPVSFKPLDMLTNVKADVDKNAFKDNNMFAYINYADIASYPHTVLTGSTQTTEDGIYILEDNSHLWAVVQRISGVNHFIGYTNKF